MTTERELLELAAKAAGIDLFWDDKGQPSYYTEFRKLPQKTLWDPLEWDGDALRLAVKLRMVVGFDQDSVADTVYAYCTDTDKIRCYERAQSYPCDATRRAIVRAAAEIGRSMK